MTIDEEIDLHYAEGLLRNAVPNGACLECNRTPGTDKYPKVANNENAHRFIYRVKKGPIGTLWVMHTCDNMRCINPEHLVLGTPKDNNNDCVNKGRAILTGRPRAFSDEERERVIEARGMGISVREIAAKYFVSERLIYRVLAGES